MKLLLLLILFPIVCFSQEVPIIEGTNQIGFEKTVSSPGSTSSDIYSALKTYLIRKNSDDNFLVDQPDKLIIDAMNFPIMIESGMFPMPYTVLYNISIDIQDEEYRIIMTDYKLSQNASGTTSEATLVQWIETIDNAKRGKRKLKKTKASMLEDIHRESEAVLEELSNLKISPNTSPSRQ